MESMSLEQFAEMSQGQVVEARPPQLKVQDYFQPGLAYPIQILEGAHTTSKNGFEQLELKVAIIEPDGSLRPAGRLWETLPLLDHKADELGEERTAMYRNIFGRNTLGFLRAIEPRLFQVYAKREGQGRHAVYYDHEGERMTVEERNKRTAAVEAAVVGAARAIKEGKLSLEGKRLYLVKVTGTNGRVYQNYFSDVPDKYPLASESDNAIPF